MSKKVVYVVDDDDAMRDSLYWLIRSAGYETVLFPDVEKFLDAYDPNSNGCLILDLKLPGLSGTDLQQRLMELRSILPIIFITGYGDVATAASAMRKGAVDFLEKPFDEEVLLRRIREAFDLMNVRDSQRQAMKRVDTLTDREKQILEFVTNGYSSKEIAAELNRSEKTVEGHRRNIMRKLEAESVADVVRIATVANRDKQPRA